MIEMKYTSTKYGPMVVNTRAKYCGCTWNVKITGQDRMGGYTDDEVKYRATALKTPKQWYRAAENVLLATGKVVSRKSVTPNGVVVSYLDCKEHN